MYNIPWWYLAFTELSLLAGLLSDPGWFYAAIALCIIQAIHFGIEDKNFLSLSCQVRYVMLGMFLLGLQFHWVYWIPAIGLAVRLTLNYCLLARLMTLLPWNRKEHFSWNLFKRTIFSRPTKGPILKAIVSASLILALCAPAYATTAQDLKVGNIYSVEDGEGGYDIVKLLVHQDGGCHVRIYDRKSATRPMTVDISSLKTSIGHVPLSEKGFLSWKPELLAESTISEEDLQGYRIWLGS
jgi:hypothetical protein